MLSACNVRQIGEKSGSEVHQCPEHPRAEQENAQSRCKDFGDESQGHLLDLCDRLKNTDNDSSQQGKGKDRACKLGADEHRLAGEICDGCLGHVPVSPPHWEMISAVK